MRWKVQPQPAMTRGEYDSTITSHQASSLSMVAWPASVVGSAVKLRLPVLMSLKKPVESKTPSWKAEGVTPRIGSALVGHSTLITSAPSAARTLVDVGPATFQEKSSTLVPASGLNVIVSILIRCSASRCAPLAHNRYRVTRPAAMMFSRRAGTAA